MVQVVEVGSIIREARQALHMSQFEAAAAAGWTQSQQSLLERGAVSNLRTIMEAARIAKANEAALLSALERALPKLRESRHGNLVVDVEAALAAAKAAA